MNGRVRHIDLNADLGEGEATDVELLAIVSSCNIACGGHAGDEESMSATVAAAAAAGVTIGAHPSYPDREGFGRRSHFMDARDLLPELERQVSALVRVAGLAGVPVRHVKPHGALYNDAAEDTALANAVCVATRAVDPHLRVVGPPSSELERAAKRSGLEFIAEGFVDRAYLPGGALVPRSEPGSVHRDPEKAAGQARDIATLGVVRASSGDAVPLDVQTLCIHGDTPGAVKSAAAVRAALEAADIEIRSVAQDL